MQLYYRKNVPGDLAVKLCVHYSGLIKLNLLSVVESNDKLSISAAPDLTEPTTCIQFLLTKTPSEIQNVLLCLDDPIKHCKVLEWLSFAADRGFEICSSLQVLNEYLLDKTFFVGSHVTLADLVLFSSLHSWFTRSPKGEILCNPCLCRWFDKIQHLPGIYKHQENPFSYIENLTVVSESTYLKGKSAQTNVEKNGSEEISDQTDKKSNLKEPLNQEKSLKKSTQHQKATDSIKTTNSTLDDISRLDIRVGKIIKVWLHPDAERLYCELIDLGEKEPRQICSGLRNIISTDVLLDGLVLVLANLKPRKFRGEMSHGMVLCGNSGAAIELVRPPGNSIIGERVKFEGYEGLPDTVLSSKPGQDVFAAIQPNLSIGADGSALWKGLQFKTALGVCRCESLTSGSIS